MDCFACEKKSGYNRAIIELFSGVEIGRFCLRCELVAFGIGLQEGYWADVERCAFCNRDDQYALPLYLPIHEEHEGMIHCSVEYEVTDGTVALCDEHLHRLRGIDERGQSRPPPPSERN